MNQISNAENDAVMEAFEEPSSDEEIGELNNMILQLKAPKFVFRGKNREIWEVDFNPEEPIFYRDVS